MMNNVSIFSTRFVVCVMLLSCYFNIARIQASEVPSSGKSSLTDCANFFETKSNEAAYTFDNSPDGGYMITGMVSSEKEGPGYVYTTDEKGKIVQTVEFKKTENTGVSAISATHDGGYVLAGRQGERSRESLWAMKVDKDGETQWERVFKFKRDSSAFDVRESSDGGYILSGSAIPEDWSRSFGLVIKLDSNGYLLWDNDFMSEDETWLLSTRETSDGKFVSVGITSLFEPFIVKLNNSGTLEHGMCYFDKEKNEYILPPSTSVYLKAPAMWNLQSVAPLENGGYVVAGYFLDNTISDLFDGTIDQSKTIIIVAEYDASGQEVASKTYNDNHYGVVRSIVKDATGGYYVVAINATKLSNSSEEYPNIDMNVLVLKLDKLLNVEWEKIFGSDEYDEIAYKALGTPDGELAIIGAVKNNGTDSGKPYFLKLDSSGECGI